ncbi:MAG: CRISPR-associated endonuclease Cas2 [Deltaproteobacteria bacterium]|nr:CRISPR-associated endonuclease Cas2 [Deltaproteobacteria bacterium]
MNMIVAYDIADERRLAKVAKIISDYGVRVQKSIFEVTAPDKIFAEMKSRVEDVLVWEKDGVKYYPLCRKCAETAEIIGQGMFIDPDEEYYIY